MVSVQTMMKHPIMDYENLLQSDVRLKWDVANDKTLFEVSLLMVDLSLFS